MADRIGIIYRVVGGAGEHEELRRQSDVRALEEAFLALTPEGSEAKPNFWKIF